MIKFPITIVDDFFENPDEIVEWAKSLDFDNVSPIYPGKRTKNLLDIDPTFCNLIFHKMAMIWGINTIPNYLNSQFFFQRIKGGYDICDIHRDTQYMSMIVYLSESKENSGTSFYKRKTIYHNVLDEEKERLNNNIIHKGDENSYVEMENLCIKQKEDFEKTLDVNNVYNRMVLWDNDWHSANKYASTEDDEDRLSLIMFFEDVTFQGGTPLIRMRELGLI